MSDLCRHFRNLCRISRPLEVPWFDLYRFLHNLCPACSTHVHHIYVHTWSYVHTSTQRYAMLRWCIVNDQHVYTYTYHTYIHTWSYKHNNASLRNDKMLWCIMIMSCHHTYVHTWSYMYASTHRYAMIRWCIRHDQHVYIHTYSSKHIAFERIDTHILTKNRIFFMIDFGRMVFGLFANLSFMQNREKFKNHKTSAQLARSDCRAPTMLVVRWELATQNVSLWHGVMQQGLLYSFAEWCRSDTDLLPSLITETHYARPALQWLREDITDP